MDRLKYDRIGKVTGMQINGKVSGSVEILNDRVTYDVISEEQRFHIYSKDRQAVKDAIFLKEGQYIEISGIIDKDKIKSKGSKIDITRL